MGRARNKQGATGIINAIRTIKREGKRVKGLKAQSAERSAYNKMQRNRKLKPSESRAAAGFIAKGKPRPKY